MAINQQFMTNLEIVFFLCDMNFKKVIGLLVFSLVILTGAFSQDIIWLRTGEKLEGKVIEVGIDEIKYRKMNSPKGPLYALDKNDILQITYVDGSTEKFEKSERKNYSELHLGEKRDELISSVIEIRGYEFYYSNKKRVRDDKLTELIFNSGNQKAIEMYKKGVKQRTSSKLLGFAMIPVGVIGVATYSLLSYDKSLENIGDAAIVLAVVAAGALLVADFTWLKKSKRTKVKAVKIYNKSVE